MGTVYEVVRSRDDERFALKVIRRNLAKGESTVERFKREARVLGTIGHPSVVQMVDAGLMSDGSVFFVMELLKGETFFDFFKREVSVIAVEIVPIARGIAAVLDAVHV